MSVAKQSSIFGGVGADLSGKRVLLVEDEFLISMDLEESLRQRGAVIVGPAATLGRALLLAGTKCALDCALLDINLQGDMVFPVADVLAKRSVPFMFLTGYEDIVIPPQYDDVPHYKKPFNYAAVMAALSRLLAKKTDLPTPPPSTGSIAVQSAASTTEASSTSE
jgi:DNA-binding response OmpR family regulator